MPASNEYKRYFIILQEDDRGFEMAAGKIPTGYVKIEVKNGKGKLTAFVQHLKKDGKSEYKLILVAPNKKVAVEVGNVMLDSSGRGELSCEFESDNVLRSSYDISEFMVAALTSGSAIPLSGYAGREKIDWKGKYEIVNVTKSEDKNRIDKKKEIIPEIKTVPVVPEVTTPIHVPQVEPEPEPTPPPKPTPEPAPQPAEPPVSGKGSVEINAELNFISQPIIMPEMPKPMPAPEYEIEEPCPAVPCPGVMPMPDADVCDYKENEGYSECDDSSDDSCDERDRYVSSHQDYYYYESDEHDARHKDNKHKKESEKWDWSCQDEKTEPSYYNTRMYRRLRKLLRKLRDYEPFDMDDRNFEWFRVYEDMYMLNDILVPCMGVMMPLSYPFLVEETMNPCKKDYILGVKYEKGTKGDWDEDRKHIRYLIYGVPGLHNPQTEAYYRMRGFVSFKPHKNKKYGYFLMCIDLYSGMLCRMK